MAKYSDVYEHEIVSRLNSFYKEIFDKYSTLNEENIENLRNFIESFISSMRPTAYKKEEYKNTVNKYLYPDIYLVGLAKLYSKDKYIQYSFLMNVDKAIEIELNKDNKVKKL